MYFSTVNLLSSPRPSLKQCAVVPLTNRQALRQCASPRLLNQVPTTYTSSLNSGGLRKSMLTIYPSQVARFRRGGEQLRRTFAESGPTAATNFLLLCIEGDLDAISILRLPKSKFSACLTIKNYIKGTAASLSYLLRIGHEMLCASCAG